MTKERNFNSYHGSPVIDFYKGGCIFVTGGTGFVGKALIEKLLRACPDIDILYLLIRAKKGLSPEQRCKELLDNPVFDRLRNGDFLKKVIPVAGDVMQPGLGLSKEDREAIIQKVTVVFHSAATVKFNETLQEAVKLNTMGTQEVLQLCRQMICLQAIIHVSTAYSNADKKEVKEMVYEPPASPEGIVECVKYLSSDLIEKIGEAIIEQNHPNTYTITKNMAETIVSRNSKHLPIAIVRPSIVTGAWKEPFPGWVDNVSGITGIMMEISRGTIRSIICNDKFLVDIIPVDIVVDSLIVAAWHTAINKASPKESKIMVYNCTSGTLNPIYWHQLGDLTLKHCVSMPSKYLQWYPGFSFTTNRLLHNLKDLVFHSFPAFLVDLILQIQGSKPIMMKICRRFRMAAKTGEFFALHEWMFECENQLALSTQLTESDKNIFNPDVKRLSWDEYVKVYLSGIRKYVLKDGPESLPSARRKLRRMYWLQLCAKATLIILLLKFFLLR